MNPNTSEMTEVMKATASSGGVDQFLRAFKQLDGHQLNGSNGHVHALRSAGIEAFGRLGLPAPRDESWKYTPIARSFSKDFTLDVQPQESRPSARIDVDALRVPGTSGPLVVLIDGTYSEAHSRVSGLPAGVTVCSLSAAMSDHELLVNKHLGAYCNIQSETFEALNTAFVHDGAFIHVDRGASTNEPIEILCLSSGREGVFVQPRILAVAEEGSRLSLVEHQRSLTAATAFVNTVCEISADRNANVDHYRIQLDSDDRSLICTTRIYQREASAVSTFSATLGGKLVRNNLFILPDAEHCETHLNGLFVGRGDRHIDNHTFVDHAKPDCESNELYKGILDDRSTGVFNGKVFVRRDAQKTNAYQSNKSVVLTNTARMYAKPELEIYADDVKCSHGATTGQLDAEALFYLQSRGLSLTQARTMLLNAFAGDVLQLISVDAVRAYVDELVSREITAASR